MSDGFRGFPNFTIYSHFYTVFTSKTEHKVVILTKIWNFRGGKFGGGERQSKNDFDLW